MRATTCRRAYDHRMRDLVCEERDPGLFQHLGLPRSTGASWIRRGPRPVVSADVLAMNSAELQAEVLSLRRRVRFLPGVVRLAFLLVRISGFRLDSQRVLDRETKRSILAAIASAQKAIPLAVALRVLRLPPARFHTWRNLADNCTLEDRSSCPRTTPAQLTAEEIATIGSMVQDASLKHGWLYLHQIDTFAALENLIAARLKSNRQLSCGACRPPVRDPPGLPDPSADSRMLHLHDEISGMS